MKSNEVAMKRQRAKSMFVDQAERRMETAKKKSTMDDFHLEFAAKFNAPNHGLKPSANRLLRQVKPKDVPKSQKIFDEFQAKLQARYAKN